MTPLELALVAWYRGQATDIQIEALKQAKLLREKWLGVFCHTEATARAVQITDRLIYEGKL